MVIIAAVDFVTISSKKRPPFVTNEIFGWGKFSINIAREW